MFTSFELRTVMVNSSLNVEYDYSYVDAVARVALYDDMKSAPRITKVEPSSTTEFIEKLTTTIYEQSKLAGGHIPYTIIREVSENFIHAQFKEIVVSILDDGNTIRFCDQGPGISEKEKAQQPGFSSAIEPMKSYIRGVGSGLPIVREYLDEKNGYITIEDNLVSGAVVTISVANQPQKKPVKEQPPQEQASPIPTIHLSEMEQQVMQLLMKEDTIGVVDTARSLDKPQSSIYNVLSKLEKQGLVRKTDNKKRILTDLGIEVASSIR